MKHYILSLILISGSAFGMSLQRASGIKATLDHKVEVVQVTPQATINLTRHGKDAAILFTQNKFTVITDGCINPVSRDNLCKRLQSVSTDKLKDLLSKEDGYITIKQNDAGQYTLSYGRAIKCQGAAGASAGFYIGKFITHFIGHGTIQIIALCTGPLYPVTLASLEATCIVPLEAASNVVGLACGVAAGVATGPV